MTISKCSGELVNLFKTEAKIHENLERSLEISARMKALFAKAILGLGIALLSILVLTGLLGVTSVAAIVKAPLLVVAGTLLVGFLLSGIGLILVGKKERIFLEEKRMELQTKAKMEQTKKQSVSSEAASESEAGEDLETRGQEEVDGPFGPKRPVSAEEKAVKVVKVEEPEGGASTEEESDPIEGSPVAGASEEGFEGEEVKGGAGAEEKSSTETELGTTSTQTREESEVEKGAGSEEEPPASPIKEVAEDLKALALKLSEEEERCSEVEEESFESAKSEPVLAEGIKEEVSRAVKEAAEALKGLALETTKVLTGGFEGVNPLGGVPLTEDIELEIESEKMKSEKSPKVEGTGTNSENDLGKEELAS
ncbi:hypothetical protein [Chlamydiifrater volucris]|uniref:hypothetical protein n=1 Tax=Chlamydiifrater volucris TaxID=2681470 RepID=UPI0032B1F145